MADIKIKSFPKPIRQGTTIKNLLAYYKINMEQEEFLNYRGNKARIEEQRASFDSDEQDVPEENLFIGSPLIIVPIEKINKESLFRATFSNNREKYLNAPTFYDEKMKRVLLNDSYAPLNKVADSKVGSIHKLYSRLSVVLWSKSLGPATDGVPQGGFFDLTPFIMNLTLNEGENGANFSISLPPIDSKFLEKWKANHIHGYQATQSHIDFLHHFAGIAYQEQDYQKSESFIEGSRNYTKQNKYRRNIDLFTKIIQSNDLIFIAFEELEFEHNEQEIHSEPHHKKETKHEEEIRKDESGLRDKYTELRRKISKKLRPEKYKRHKHISVPQELGASVIPETFWDCIGLVDSCSVSYADKSNITVSVKGRDLMKLFIEDGEYFFNQEMYAVNGRQFFKYQDISEIGEASKRLLADRSLNVFKLTQDLDIRTIVQYVINNLSHVEICHEDVFGSYNEEELSKRITDEDKFENISGVWSIVKLVIDESVEDRRVADSGLATHQGSLLSFINKVCQKPFVEFYGQTFGPFYYLIVRKPPFDKEGFTTNYVVDIDEGDIYSDNLRWDDSQVYSWYRLNPQGIYNGLSQQYSQLDFPAVFFKRIAQIWGSRPLDQQSNYVGFFDMFKQTAEEDETFDYLKELALDDLRYLIESNVYLPFTRKGQITIRRDRRIKRGMNVRHKGTGEVFFVDSVSHTFTVSETTYDEKTVLTVSRGVVESKIDWYFDIVDFDEVTRKVDDPQSEKSEEEDLFFFFDFNQDTLDGTRQEENEKVFEDVKKIIDRVGPQNITNFVLEGHTDSIGSDTYNINLGKRRAEKVKSLVVREYPDLPVEVQTISFGESKPAFPNKDKQGNDSPKNRAKNRRTTLKLSYLPEGKKQKKDQVDKVFRFNNDIYNKLLKREQFNE
jgi:outer membrane protein OmpA-like peptidoglycan-associated protein